MTTSAIITDFQKTALLAAAQLKLADLTAMATNKLLIQIQTPDVLLTQRGRIAGSAVLQKNTIKLNPILFQQNYDAFINDVIAHEFSHLLVFRQFGRVRPHGREWKAMMQDVFGINAQIRHTFDVSDVTQKHFDYYCGCGPVKLSLIRHRRVVSGKQRYICRKCHVELHAHPV